MRTLHIKEIELKKSTTSGRIHTEYKFKGMFRLPGDDQVGR